jgi:hypothetical protein
LRQQGDMVSDRRIAERAILVTVALGTMLAPLSIRP